MSYIYIYRMTMQSYGNFEEKYHSGKRMSQLFSELENVFQWTEVGPGGKRGDPAHRIASMLPGEDKIAAS